MTKRQQAEYMPADELAPLLGRTKGWIYYHGRTADGPVRVTWGIRVREDKSEHSIKLFHVEDCRYLAEGYKRGVNAGKLYPGSLVQERLAEPETLRLIEAHKLHDVARKVLVEVVQPYKKRRPALRAVAGGRA